LSIAYDRKNDAACALRETGRRDAVTILPASQWKLSERDFFKLFLSIGDAIRTLIDKTSQWSKGPPVTFPGCSASTSSAAAG